MHLLDLLLPLMRKQQLSGNVLEPLSLSSLLRRLLVLVQLDREIPEGHLVVCA